MSQGVDARNISRALALVLFPAESVGFGPCDISLGAKLSGLGAGWHRFGSGTNINITRGVDLQRAGDSSSASTARRFTKDWHAGGEVKQ